MYVYTLILMKQQLPIENKDGDIFFESDQVMPQPWIQQTCKGNHYKGKK